ncbi:MAG: M20/M25/M40 family metallo-hydrolase [Spirochaetales bacterium]|nr:M20/M25/M40 family metallo-hydrolase [Spirochaetales bacterium]
MRRVLVAIPACIIVLLGFLVFRTILFQAPDSMQTEAVSPASIDSAAAGDRLSRAIQLRTVSLQEAPPPAGEMFRLHALIARSFPLVHASLRRETINGYSLLYTWQGRNAELDPVLLMGHLDVVPVGLEEWTQPGFSGAIADGYIWGRGALDDKSQVFGILEAVESLLREGFVPERTVYLAFGHDEELNGTEGAGVIAERFRQSGTRFSLVTDEGMIIADGIVPGVAKPVALIGIAQKGEGSLRLSVSGETGHSSMPPPNTTVGILSRAIVQIEENPMPATLDGPIGMMFDRVGPAMPFGQRLVFANRWLFDPVILSQLEAKPQTNASVRTTLAATMFQGSLKDNQLPYRATAVVNFRVHPRDNIDAVREHVRESIDDERIQVEVLPGAREPSSVTDPEGAAYRVVEKSVREVFPDILVAPALFIAISDTRHFADLSDNIIRFHPLWLRSEDTARIHGVNERISVENYLNYIRYYRRLLENLPALDG